MRVLVSGAERQVGEVAAALRARGARVTEVTDLADVPAVCAALPALTPDARVTFVLGTLPPEAATADDREARRALTRVLGHAACADNPDGHLTPRVLDAGAAPTDIAQVALGLDPGRQELMERLADLSYADRRVELLGLAAVET